MAMNINVNDLQEISKQEMIDINGGSFWRDLAYAIGYTSRTVKDISETMREKSAYGNANVYK